MTEATGTKSPGRPARDESPAAKAKREQARKAAAAAKAEALKAAAGDGWETVSDPADLIVEQEKIGPYAKIALDLAKLGDKAQTRRDGWVQRLFNSEDEVKIFTSGLRRALQATGYSLRSPAPVMLPKGTELRNGHKLDRPMVRAQFRASKTQTRKSS
jgi:hypothetical protein